MQKIAFLGTGLMGAPMARNLLKAGFSATVWNRTIAKASALEDAGAVVAASARDAVADADVVVSIVTSGEAVDDLLFKRGVADAMRPKSVFIDMSSITPREARRNASALQERNVACLDAPVSGGTKGAEDATLAIMVGGESGVFERVRPVLQAMGRPVRVGPAGAGQLAKLANQAIVGITIGAVAEATLLVSAGGGDAEAFRDALTGGFADSKILQIHGKRMTERDFTPGGKSSIQLKDMNNILAEAEELGLKLPLSGLIRDRYESLVREMDGGELDHAALFLELGEQARRR